MTSDALPIASYDTLVTSDASLREKDRSENRHPSRKIQERKKMKMIPKTDTSKSRKRRKNDIAKYTINVALCKAQNKPLELEKKKVRLTVHTLKSATSIILRFQKGS